RPRPWLARRRSRWRRAGRCTTGDLSYGLRWSLELPTSHHPPLPEGSVEDLQDSAGIEPSLLPSGAGPIVQEECVLQVHEAQVGPATALRQRPQGTQKILVAGREQRIRGAERRLDPTCRAGPRGVDLAACAREH